MKRERQTDRQTDSDRERQRHRQRDRQRQRDSQPASQIQRQPFLLNKYILLIISERVGGRKKERERGREWW